MVGVGRSSRSALRAANAASRRRRLSSVTNTASRARQEAAANAEYFSKAAIAERGARQEEVARKVVEEALLAKEKRNKGVFGKNGVLRRTFRELCRGKNCSKGGRRTRKGRARR